MVRIVLTGVLFLTLASASYADFRADNYWMTGKSLAEKNLRVYANATWATCGGDFSGDYAVNRARGLYHHFVCGATVRGHPGGFFGLDLWVIGPALKNMRITNISWHAA
jgi:hypothetical protein